jgi:predicted anti-sigma-YlaC factor YlaD
MKAKNCDECKHFSETLATYKRPCKLLHRPRFYVPRTTTQAEAGDYGWKRRCNDFDRGER